MKNYSFILLLVILASSTLNGQVTFVVNSIPEYTPPEDILYIAGNINSWDPGNPDFTLSKNDDDNWFIVLPEEPDGTLVEFKFTRGDWGKVEKGAMGEEIDNRKFIFGNGDTVYVDILNWADNGGGGGSTAADNVSIMDNDFYMPQLNRTRRIWVYLPPDYNENSEDYPVLYMHDGQNLFDSFTAYSGEWEVDETLNNLFNDGYQVPIVIGIDNGGVERINEYSPWVNPQDGGGQGEEYMEFIVNTLKPYVDSNYRTITHRESTGIMGSSLGGLISQYGSLKYQDVFSKAGIFSPSYSFSDSVWIFTNQTGKQQSMKLYQLMGGQEGATAVADMMEMQETLNNLGFNDDELFSLEVPGGEHNEAFWRSQFAAAYLWLFNTYASDIIDVNDGIEIAIIPNPVGDEIFIDKYIQGKKGDSLVIVDMKGIQVMKINIENLKKVNVSKLIPGSYILILLTNENVYKGKFVKQ